MKESKMRFQINCQKGMTRTYEFSKNDKEIRDDEVCIQFERETHNDSELGKLRIELRNDPCRINYHLEMEHPVRVFIELDEKPEKMTAMYLLNEWWTRPAFVDSYKDIPGETQILFAKYKDFYACIVPMVGERYKTYLMPGTDEEMCFEMTAYLGGIRKLDEPLYLMTEADTLYGAVQKCMKELAMYKGIRLREERVVPEMFRYLGWCSWDAFYADITEEKVRQKAKELHEKSVPVKWMIMDDGWMSSEQECLKDFVPDKMKFPNGFAQMVADIRKETGIKWFGVWHTLAGYWGGIVPGSELAERERDYLIHTVNGKILPSPKNGAGFFEDWYTYLNAEGIDFTKVDGQSAIRNHYENTMAVSEAAKGSNPALEHASAWMKGAIINCMGMAMENILARPNSAVSRNSDDFVPALENGFAEHLLQNAYNSIYHNEIYCCDWDMFWTSHPDSKKHSFLRAISGGPAYFSDRIGDTDFSILEPLMYQDGELLMMNASAKPTEDCVFMDPFKEGTLKLMNTFEWGKETAGGIATFNLTKEDHQTAFTSEDIQGLADAEEYWVYDFFKKEATVIRKGESYLVTTRASEYGWYLVFPKRCGHACIGLLDKYVGGIAVAALREKESVQSVILKEIGKIGWLSEVSPQVVVVDGKDMSDKVRNVSTYLYELDLPIETDKCAITVLWNE